MLFHKEDPAAFRQHCPAKFFHHEVGMLRRARGRKVDLVLISDAHKPEELERVANAACHAQRAGIEAEQVVNAGEVGRFLRRAGGEARELSRAAQISTSPWRSAARPLSTAPP